MIREEIADFLVGHHFLVPGPAGAVQAAAVAFHLIVICVPVLQQLMEELGRPGGQYPALEKEFPVRLGTGPVAEIARNAAGQVGNTGRYLPLPPEAYLPVLDHQGVRGTGVTDR